MRDRSATWKELATRGEFQMETVAVIGGVEYSTITAPVIRRSLLQEKSLSVGNCIAASMELTVMTTDTIPRSAQIVIKSRLTDGTAYSEWIEFGTFWVNHRSADDDLIDLQCYDAMLKGNQPYNDTDETLNWPKPMSTVVSNIASQMGVQLDSRTVIHTGDAYMVTKPDDKTSLLTMLGYIAGIHGGNWIITPENKLRLVPVVSPPDETFNIIDYDYNRIQTDDGYKLVWQHTQTQEIVEHRGGGGLLNVPVVIGHIDTGRQYTISRVTMTLDADTGFTAGDDTGVELLISENPYVSQAACNALLAELAGTVYVPFTAQGASYDPAAELGDWIIIGDRVRGVLYAETATLDLSFSADISAPGEEELEEEYPYKGEIVKLKLEDKRLQEYADNVNRTLSSSIQQTQTSILATVSDTYETKTDASSKLAEAKLYADGISLSVSQTYETKTDAASKLSEAKLYADGITLSVSQTYETKTDASSKLTEAKGYTDSSVNTAKSEIKVTTDGISLEVSRKVGSTEVQSMIDQSADAIRLKAGRISWDSNFSSMTELGKLTCRDATITGSVTSTASYYNGTRTTKMDDGSITFYYNNDQIGFIFGEVINGQTVKLSGAGVSDVSLEAIHVVSGTQYGSALTLTQSGTIQITTTDITMGDGRSGVTKTLPSGQFQTADGLTIVVKNGFVYEMY